MIYKADDIIDALTKCTKEDKEAVYNAIYAAKEDTTYKDQLAAFNRSMQKVWEQGDFDQDAAAASLVNRLV